MITAQSGNLTVDGLDLRLGKSVSKVKNSCSMVFQNPENQFVSSIVEEDLKFTLKCLNASYNDDVINKALSTVGLEGFNNKNIASLSGGQKQRLAIANALIRNSKVLLLDEATTMLPPENRKEIIDLIYKINKEQSITVIMVTQYIEEAVNADKILVMNDGKIVLNGTPQDVLSDKSTLENAGLKPPISVRLYYDLKKEGVVMDECPITTERLVDLIVNRN